jgi:hypothetical protein
MIWHGGLSLKTTVRLRVTCSAVALLCLLSTTGCNKSTSTADPKADKPPEGASATKPELKYGLTPEQAAQVLVQVGETKITLGDFAERLGSQSPYLRARYNSPERRKEFLDNMVRFELLAAEADKRGLSKTEDVERVRRQVMVQQMMQDLFDKGGLKLADISDDEIKRYYDAHASEFNKPAQVRASHILFKDRAAAEQALKELKQKPGDNELFRKLVEQKSQDAATKSNAGDLRFFSETEDKSGETDEPTRPAAVRKAAFSMANTGDVYRVPRGRAQRAGLPHPEAHRPTRRHAAQPGRRAAHDPEQALAREARAGHREVRGGPAGQGQRAGERGSAGQGSGEGRPGQRQYARRRG